MSAPSALSSRGAGDNKAILGSSPKWLISTRGSAGRVAPKGTETAPVLQLSEYATRA